MTDDDCTEAPMEECVICGKRLADDEPRNSVAGQPACADAAACIGRWITQSTTERRRDLIRNLDPVTNVETR